MNIEEVLLDAEEEMEKALEFMRHELSSIRTGKASPALVENIEVHAYGSMMRLKQVAAISAPEARLLMVQPFDVSTLKDIERAIHESRLGLTPVVDGKCVRIPIPELSEERRKSLVKTVKGIAEDMRVRVRGSRRKGLEVLKGLEKIGEISEDSLHESEKKMQKLTDQSIAALDALLAHKEADIMKI